MPWASEETTGGKAGLFPFEEGDVGHQNSDKAGHSGGHHAIFRFTYRSIPFCVLFDIDDASGEGILEGNIGLIPFTGEGEKRRSNTLAIIDAAQRIPDYHIQIRTDYSIRLSAKLPAPQPASADMILAGALCKLADAKKLLDLLQSFQPPHLRAQV